MILNQKKQNSKRLNLKFIFLLLLSPFIFKAQTIPSTTVTGCLKVNQTTSTGNLDVAGSGRVDSSFVVGDTMKAQDVIVTGNAKIAGDINLNGKLLFDSNNNLGISFTPVIQVDQERFI